MSLVLGIDMGTSGARVLALGEEVEVEAKASLQGDPRDPFNWLEAMESALATVLETIDISRITALCVDGTSGTMVPVDDKGQPVGSALMYNDPCTDSAILSRISAVAPPTSAAHGASSALARAIILQDRGTRLLHQADWLAFQFSGRFISDENNALKTGFDPIAGEWPAWIEETGVQLSKLPEILAAGNPIGKITKEAANLYGFPETTLVVAGTTDGCAAFLATGASRAGDGVSSLGTTLTVKLLSDKPIFAPESGVYSHKVLGNWLAGGASNSGGSVLLQHFTLDEMEALSASIDPSTPSAFKYYPLPRKGERFPHADPDMEPRMEPVPDDRAEFLKAIFDGIARVEEMAYHRLSELGGPPLSSLRSVGGGGQNPVWTQLRQNRLNVSFEKPISNEAAYGSALLALNGAKLAGLQCNGLSRWQN